MEHSINEPLSKLEQKVKLLEGLSSDVLLKLNN